MNQISDVFRTRKKHPQQYLKTVVVNIYRLSDRDEFFSRYLAKPYFGRFLSTCIGTLIVTIVR